MVKVVTIEGEYGCGASDIAQAVAECLGWKLWDQALTSEIARKLECDRVHIEQREERRDPLHYRLFKAFLRGSFEGSLNMPNMRMADADGIRAVTEQIIKRAAEDGNCVIVGRGAAHYLRNSPETFRVFIYAPFKEKVRRLEGAGNPRDEAVHLAESVDSERGAFIKQHFGVEWPRRDRYHLMVNSAMGDVPAVRAILEGVKAFDPGLAAGRNSQIAAKNQ
jgi:cytidylate kinase